MAFSRADNAVMAKVHSLYGKRLREGDYNSLLQKRSTGEIAGYLKGSTYYSGTLSEVKEDMIHREQLENILGRSALDAYLRLSKYSYEDKLLLKIYIMQNEAEQLTAAVRLLNVGEMDRFITAFPAYLSKHMSFDLFKVAASKTYDDLMNSVAGTEYYQTLGKFRPIHSGARVDITALEAELLTRYYEKILGFVRELYGGRARESLEKMICLRADLHNFDVIYRMKRYFGKKRPAIASLLLPVKSLFSKQVYGDMLDATDYAAATEIFGRQRVCRAYQIGRESNEEHMIAQLQRIKQQVALVQFRFSIEPAVAVYAYMTLLDIEIRNIVNIIEGVRYDLPRDEIRKILVV